MGGIARRQKYGVAIHEPDKAYKGYTYFDAYYEQNRAFLIDMEGRVVHYWDLPGMFADFTELLPNGHVLAPVRRIWADSPKFPGFCACTIYEVDWDGNIVWEYSDDFQHHCVKRLDNGNTLVMRVEQCPPDLAAKVQGGMPGTEDEQEKWKGYMWADNIQEVNKDGEVVWEWTAHEHLDVETEKICTLEERSEWSHGNNLEVLPNGDILTTFRCINTCAIIDKQTGKIKWKWGADELCHPHNPTPLDNGNVLIFDNGVHRKDSYADYSRIVEVNPDTNEIVWEYKSTPITEFYSTFCGGAHRLPNGNTFICEANKGRLFEVTKEGDIAWEYLSPFYSLNQDVGDDARDFGHCPWIHRAHRFGLDFSAFKGKDLNPDKYKAINMIYGTEGFRSV
ncbi:aryl-sulfate sulfotransferase [Verrucomicrobiota bacterium]